MPVACAKTISTAIPLSMEFNLNASVEISNAFYKVTATATNFNIVRCIKSICNYIV